MLTREDITSQVNLFFNEFGIDKTTCYLGHGSAMVMQGIIEETNDIDMYVDKQVWDHLLIRGMRYKTLPAVGNVTTTDVITIGDINIEKRKEVYGVLLIADGIQYTSILDTLKAKLQLNRSKDQDSIRKLRMVSEAAYGFSF